MVNIIYGIFVNIPPVFLNFCLFFRNIFSQKSHISKMVIFIYPQKRELNLLFDKKSHSTFVQSSQIQILFFYILAICTKRQFLPYISIFKEQKRHLKPFGCRASHSETSRSDVDTHG